MRSSAQIHSPKVANGAMLELIEAALAHADELEAGALAGDDYGARVSEEDAERWRTLGAAASLTGRYPSRDFSSGNGYYRK
jgi:hypothetical protein